MSDEAGEEICDREAATVPGRPWSEKDRPRRPENLHRGVLWARQR